MHLSWTAAVEIFIYSRGEGRFSACVLQCHASARNPKLSVVALSFSDCRRRSALIARPLSSSQLCGHLRHAPVNEREFEFFTTRFSGSKRRVGGRTINECRDRAFCLSLSAEKARAKPIYSIRSSRFSVKTAHASVLRTRNKTGRAGG